MTGEQHERAVEAASWEETMALGRIGSEAARVVIDSYLASLREQGVVLVDLREVVEWAKAESMGYAGTNRDHLATTWNPPCRLHRAPLRRQRKERTVSEPRYRVGCAGMFVLGMDYGMDNEAEAIVACEAGPVGCEVYDTVADKWIGPTCWEDIEDAKAQIAAREAPDDE